MINGLDHGNYLSVIEFNCLIFLIYFCLRIEGTKSKPYSILFVSAECSSLSSCNPNTANQNMHAYGALLIVSRIYYGIEQVHALLSLYFILLWLSSMENFHSTFLSCSYQGFAMVGF